MMRSCTPAEVPALQQSGLKVIDVRTEEEFAGGRPSGAVLVTAFAQGAGGMEPVPDFAQKVEAIAPDKSAPLIVSCRSGARSARAIAMLEAVGYTDCINLEGGFMAWAADPSLPTEK